MNRCFVTSFSNFFLIIKIIPPTIEPNLCPKEFISYTSHHYYFSLRYKNSTKLRFSAYANKIKNKEVKKCKQGKVKVRFAESCITFVLSLHKHHTLVYLLEFINCITYFLNK